MAANGEGPYEDDICSMLVLANPPLLHWYAHLTGKSEEAWLLKRTGRAFSCMTVNSGNRKQHGGWLLLQTFLLKLCMGLKMYQRL